MWICSTECGSVRRSVDLLDGVVWSVMVWPDAMPEMTWGHEKYVSSKLVDLYVHV